MPRFKRSKNLKDWKSPRPKADQGKLRIVGGKFRGRQVTYSGDPLTRPMKDNIREAIFNLAGGYVEGKVAFDLFAGTGAIGLEALSRGAAKAFFVERHIPTLRIVRENVQSIAPDCETEIAGADSFFWVRQFIKQPDTWPKSPWVVFCCPPYALYVDRKDDLLTMLKSLINVAPENSVFLVESDDQFDPASLPDSLEWNSRQYAPALVSIAHKRQEEKE